MIFINKVHHIAIICSDYQKSKHFYTKVLNLQILNETYRSERQSYKLDLSLNGEYIIELFSFPKPPQRITNPEAAGLRHLAFEVEDIELVINELKKLDVFCEPIRIDEKTRKKFTFTEDPDHTPIEFYER